MWREIGVWFQAERLKSVSFKIFVPTNVMKGHGGRDGHEEES